MLQQLKSKEDQIVSLMNDMMRQREKLRVFEDERKLWLDKTRSLNSEADKKVGLHVQNYLWRVWPVSACDMAPPSYLSLATTFLQVDGARKGTTRAGHQPAVQGALAPRFLAPSLSLLLPLLTYYF